MYHGLFPGSLPPTGHAHCTSTHIISYHSVPSQCVPEGAVVDRPRETASALTQHTCS